MDAGVVLPDGEGIAAVLRAAQHLGSVRGSLTARCMAALGHREPADVISTVRPVPERYRSKPLHLVPIDLGPSTPEEARRYAFGGSAFPIDAGGGSGFFISRDPEFDADADLCEEEIERQVPPLSGLQTRAARLEGEVHEHFVDVAGPALERAVIERLECVRDRGYGELRPRRLMEAGNDSMLSVAGIEPGRETTDYQAPTEDDVAAGSVEVFPPAPAREYTASSEEREFALTYVACGRATRFFEKVRSIEADAREVTERHYRAAAADLHDDLTALVSLLQALDEEPS